MTYKKAFLVGSLMPIFALTGCDNAEKKETEKTVVETTTTVPTTPAPILPKDVPAVDTHATNTHDTTPKAHTSDHSMNDTMAKP